jgi:hypothetical protein
MFTVCTGLAAKALSSPMSNTNAFVDLSLNAFLVILFTNLTAVSLSNDLPLSLAYLCKIFAT